MLLYANKALLIAKLIPSAEVGEINPAASPISAAVHLFRVGCLKNNFGRFKSAPSLRNGFPKI